MSNEKSYNPKLDEAAHAVTEDDREMVRACLEAVMEQTSDKVEFWLLQAWASESLQGAEDAIKRAIVMDPENEIAESGLSWIRGIKNFAETQLQAQQQAEKARAEEEARIKAEEEARVREEQERLRAEEEKARAEEEARKKAEEEARVREEQERLRAEEEKARAEEEARRKAEEEARIREEQERLRAEEEKARAEEEAKRQAEEEARVEAEQERLRLEEEQQARAAEEARLKADEEARADDEKTTGPATDADHQTATSNEQQNQVASSISAETKLHETVETLANDVRQQVQTFDNDSPDSSRLDAAMPMILAVDDSPTIRKLVTLALAQQGYEIVTAEDGIEALSIIAERMPDLILSDINMPKLGGYKLCSFVKKHDRTKHIPVIMLSGKDGVFDKMRGKMNGCDAFIAKPFESRDLVEMVREHLPVRSLSNGPTD